MELVIVRHDIFINFQQNKTKIAKKTYKNKIDENKINIDIKKFI